MRKFLINVLLASVNCAKDLMTKIENRLTVVKEELNWHALG